MPRWSAFALIAAQGCGSPPPGDRAPGAHAPPVEADDTAPGEPDSGWPATAPGWTPSLTLVHDGAVLGDGATLTVETAPAGIAAPTTLTFVVTNRAPDAVSLATDPAAWLSGEGWAWDTAPPSALAPDESATFAVAVDPAAYAAADTAVATLTVPVDGGPSATLVAEIPRPLRAVATGTGGATWTSDDYGRSWTERTPGDGSVATALSVAWGDGRFLRADRAGDSWTDPGTYAWSTDGATWHASTYADEFWASDCSHGGDRFLCVRGSSITWSAAGETILFEAESWAGHLHAVTWLGDRFLAVGRSGRRAISTDGTTWASEHPWADGDSWNGVASADGRVVVVGGTDRLALGVSADQGETWAEQVVCTDRWARFEGVAWKDGMWLATASANSCPRVWTSPDGETWTGHDYGSGIRVLGVTRDAFVAVAEGWGQPSRLMWSTDGLEWTEAFAVPDGVAIGRVAVERWEGE